VEPRDGQPVNRLTRRTVLAAGVGLAAGWAAGHARAAPLVATRVDDWFRDTVRQLEFGPPVGGPSAGHVDNSVFGVEAHRAGRVNPTGAPPPALTDFYVTALFEPDPLASPWDVAVIWRIGHEMDALWWTATSAGRWKLDRAIWEITTRAAEPIVSGTLCAGVDTPVRVQALVIRSMLLCSVNGGDVVVAPLPDGRAPGQVGILANAQPEHLRPSGATPYRAFALWSVDAADVMADAPIKFGRAFC
jgi:hypothetical protein